jgi:hypothetical protein
MSKTKKDTIVGASLLLMLAIAVSLMTGAGTSVNGPRTLQSTLNFCADAGSTDSYACNMAPALAAYVSGSCYTFKANTANTGAATIAFNGLSAITIVKVAGGITTALADNDIRAGQYVSICYDGTNMQMQSTLGNAATSAVASVNGQTGAVTGTGAALILRENHAASSSASLDFTTCINSTYDLYLFTFTQMLNATNTQNFEIRMGLTTFDSGSNYSSDFWAFRPAGGGGNGGTGQTSIVLINAQDNSTNTTASGFFYLNNPLGSKFPQIVGSTFSRDSTGPLGFSNTGEYQVTTTADRLQFLYASGNIASGRAACYAVAKA